MKKFKWVVEFTVDESWVADGFELTDERAHRMLAYDLRFANNDEIKAKVLKTPKKKDIEKAQGY